MKNEDYACVNTGRRLLPCVHVHDPKALQVIRVLPNEIRRSEARLRDHPHASESMFVLVFPTFSNAGVAAAGRWEDRRTGSRCSYGMLMENSLASASCVKPSCVSTQGSAVCVCVCFLCQLAF